MITRSAHLARTSHPGHGTHARPDDAARPANRLATPLGSTVGTGMLVDQYELAMIGSLLAEGRADTPAVFEAFARRLPAGRRYGVVAGLGRIVDTLTALRFTDADLAWLTDTGTVDARTADWLAAFEFTGSLHAYAEGDLYFPHSPVLTIHAPLAQGLLLETCILSILNHDTAVASAAARMVHAADGRPLIEMGSRRTHEASAVAAARAAYLAGFTATSNVAAGRLYGIPTVGTAAHAFTLAHRTEQDAFAAQVAAHGPGTTLLVDTYDIAQGVRNAVDAAGPALGAVRIDSGDLATVSRQVRAQLDSLGATDTRIVATSDLDEHTIAALRDAPIDTYGAGTRVVTGSGHPTASMVYKLVAIDDAGTWRPVAKASAGKASIGGHKAAYRTYDSAGYITGERLEITHTPRTHPREPGRLLSVPVIVDGVLQPQPTLQQSRAFHAQARAELRPVDAHLTSGTAAFEARA